MRRHRALIFALLFALALVVSNTLQRDLATRLGDRFKNNLFVQKWGGVMEAGFVVLLVVISVLWDQKRSRETAEEPVQPRLEMRKRLIDRVLEFAQSQFDGGLYAKARKEFQLAERPLRITTADRAMDLSIEPYYRSLQEPTQERWSNIRTRAFWRT